MMIGEKPFMISVGRTARRTRESLGLTQREAAERLGVSNVHLCNIEKDKAVPSSAFLAAFRDEFDVDLYVLAWCEQGDVNSLPAGVRGAARKLQQAWSKEMSKETLTKELG